MTPLFIVVLVVSFVGIVLFLRPDAAERILERRLDAISLSRKRQADADGIELPTRHDSGLFYQLGEYVEKFDFSDDLELLILHAGSKATVGSVIGGSLVAALGLGLLLHIFFGFLLLDIAGAAVGGAARWILLRVQKGRRLKKFNEALPDAIDLMARALRAGHSMGSTVEIVAEQSHEALAVESGPVQGPALSHYRNLGTEGDGR
jgi:tight adherence protein B